MSSLKKLKFKPSTTTTTTSVITNNNDKFNGIFNDFNTNKNLLSTSANDVNTSDNDESINEGTSSYWNTEKLCEFNDNQMKLLKFNNNKKLNNDHHVNNKTAVATSSAAAAASIFVHKSCSSNDNYFTTLADSSTQQTAENESELNTSALSSRRNSIIRRNSQSNKSYLQLPTTKLRRTSLPNEERPSPSISPRRIFDYLRREFSNEDLKRRHSKSPVKKVTISTPKFSWSKIDVDATTTNTTTTTTTTHTYTTSHIPHPTLNGSDIDLYETTASTSLNNTAKNLNKLFASCDLDLAAADATTAAATDTVTTTRTTTTTTTGLSLLPSTAAVSTSLLNMPANNQTSLAATQVTTRPRKSAPNNENLMHLSVNETQPNYFSKRRNTISTIAFHKLSAASITTGFSSDKKTFDYQNSYDALQEAELFELVEQADMDNLKAKIESPQISINCSNDMGLSPLDVAIMLNHVPMIRLLIQHGAKESKKFLNSESRYNKICKCLEDLETSFKNFEQFSANQTPRDYDRKVAFFENRIKLLKRMKLNYEQAGIPESPTNVNLHVTSKTSLTVTFDEPLRNNGAIVTNYKVEWCSNQLFERLDGEALVTGIINKDYEIRNLVTGNVYYVRVSCSNMKGYGTNCLAEPAYAIPNMWRDGDSIDVKLEKYSTKLSDLKNEFKKTKENFDNLFQTIVHKTDEIKARKSTKGFRRNLINLFMPSSHQNSNSNHMSNSCNTFLNTNTNITSNKFVKQLKKGGAYLVMIAYDNEKLIITQDDNLPMIEIDDHYQLTTLQNDMQFLIKISMNWDDIKGLKKEMEQSIYTSNLHFRYQLLKVTCNLKNLMELSDLGRVYNQPLKDQDGNIYFVLTKKLKNATGGHNLKLIQINKFLQRVSTSSNDNNNNSNAASSSSGTNNNINSNSNTSSSNSNSSSNFNGNNNNSQSNGYTTSNKDYCTEIFAKNLKNIIEYDRTSDKKISKGLYLAYLKLQSSMDLVKVMVLNQRPSILPCHKIRDNPNVSKEEWQLINEICDQYKQQSQSATTNDINLARLNEKFPLNSQCKFIQEIRKSVESLASLLELSQEQINDLKIYTSSVIEINKDISLLLIYPPAEQICIIPNTDNENSQTSLSSNMINNNNGNHVHSHVLKKSLSSSKFDQLLASISNTRYIYLPIQIFETLNLYTYDRAFIKTYSKLSTSLDIEYNSTLQYQREAFSNDELTLTKQKLAILSNQQHKLDDIWKESRWLIDVINNARDRNKVCGLPVDYINEFFERKYSNIQQNTASQEAVTRSPQFHAATRIPSVVIQNESETEEQTSTLNLNDEFEPSAIMTNNNREYSYLSSGYHSEEVNTREFFDQINNLDLLPATESPQHNIAASAAAALHDNLYSSISYINLKNIKINSGTNASNSVNAKVNVIKSNVSPTSSSTSTSSISVSASASSASSTSSYTFYATTLPATEHQSKGDEFSIRPAIVAINEHTSTNPNTSTSSTNSSTKSSAQFFYNEICDDEPIELNYSSKSLQHQQEPLSSPTSTTTPPSVTSLTQSFSSLIASAYNYKTIVVHLALDSSSATSSNIVSTTHRVVNFKINSNTTAHDVIKYTLNAFDMMDVPLSPTNKKQTTFPRSLTASSSPMRSLFPAHDRDESSLFFTQTTSSSSSPSKSAYCLVIVIGCRERLLKENYCLYQLKEPWVNGRFYIRPVNDALAALKFDKKLNSIKEMTTNTKSSSSTSSSSNNNTNLIINSIDAKI